MKLETVIFILATAFTVYLVTSSSQKTSGRVSEYSEVEIPNLKEDSELLEDNNTPKTLQDLTLPQLLAQDQDTVDFIVQFSAEDPEVTAEWALALENEFARAKVLKTVFEVWAANSPRTAAAWVAHIPAFDKNLDLYLTVARTWAQTAPTTALENYRRLEKDGKKFTFGKFVTPLTKAVLEVWAANSPDLAASWVTQNISNQKERELYYPTIMHAWFENSSATRLFNWLIQFKYDETADLDSAFLMQEWVKKDKNEPFVWLSEQLKNDYINELTRIATDTLAEKDLKACEKLLNNPKMSSIKTSLVESITVKTAGADDKKALESINKLSDFELAKTICTRSALELVGKDDDALLYVKATGFLYFPKLTEFFLAWADKDSRKVLKWLKEADYHTFSTDFFKASLKLWNRDEDLKISKETAELMEEYLKHKPDLINKEIPLENLPLKFKEKFQEEISEWNSKRIEIIQECSTLWATKNYEEALSFALADSSPVFTTVCLRGILPICPDKSFVLSQKKLDLLTDNYPKRELFSYLALSKAEKSPTQTFDLLKKKGSLESTFVIQAIDKAIRHKREELNKVLDRTRTNNLHIFYPYFFYQFARINPKDAQKSLTRYSRKPWHNSALKAIAASYKDYHQARIKGWYKSLNSKEKDIISDIIN